MSRGLEEVMHDGKRLAIIVYHDYAGNGVNFFTPEKFSQQLAFMEHKAGHDIDAHHHTRTPREVEFTQEVLIIRKGKLRVDFYDDKKEYISSRVLNANDVILLASGGHGFKVLEDVEMVEVKQGPFVGSDDKVRFDGIPDASVKIIKRGE